jgi:hypothetical protein
MTGDACEAGFLTSFRTIYGFFNSWLSDMASHFDDRTALLKPKENVNHALWILGHVTWIIDGLVAEIPTGKSFREKAWDPLFKLGAERVPDEQYPSYGEVRAKYEEVRSKVGELIEGLTAEEVLRPCPAGGEWFPTPIDAMLHFLRDADYHLGQLDMIDRLIER